MSISKFPLLDLLSSSEHFSRFKHQGSTPRCLPGKAGRSAEANGFVRVPKKLSNSTIAMFTNVLTVVPDHVWGFFIAAKMLLESCKCVHPVLLC